MINLLSAELAKFNASLSESHEGGHDLISIRLASGVVAGAFAAPHDSFTPATYGELSTTARAGFGSILALAEYVAALHQVSKRSDLSETGKEQQLKPVRENIARAITEHTTSLNPIIKNVDDMETTRYAVPAIDRTDFEAVMANHRYIERIDRMSTEEKLRLMKQINDGSRDNVIPTLLRPGVLWFGDHDENLIRMANERWRSVIDERDPDGRAYIDLAKENIEWAQRVSAQVRGMLIPKLGLSREQLFNATKSQGGAKVFGISADEVLRFERRAKSA